ncbi:hypothetical protein SSBG_00827 [Streptomyces sp. SPB074]|nr:hypothetical protein SSBG_00827 [Streptomyces sp. SPB074]
MRAREVSLRAPVPGIRGAGPSCGGEPYHRRVGRDVNSGLPSSLESTARATPGGVLCSPGDSPPAPEHPRTEHPRTDEHPRTERRRTAAALTARQPSLTT